MTQTKRKVSAKNRAVSREQNVRTVRWITRCTSMEQTRNWCSYFSKSFWKSSRKKKKSFPSSLNLQEKTGESLMKGKKSMSQKKLLKWFSPHSCFVFRSCVSLIVRKKKKKKGKRSIYWIKMSKLMNAIFCSQPHIHTHTQPFLCHSQTNKTVQKKHI